MVSSTPVSRHATTEFAEHALPDRESFPLWPVRLGLVVVVLAIYWPSLNFGYVDFDDPEYVSENRHVQTGLTIRGVWWALTTGEVSNWHPATWVSLMLDTTVLGNNPRGHHAVNIALHALNALVLLGLLIRLTGSKWRSVMVAGLFAAHPMHVESVAWISERKDVLSLLLWLLTIRAYAGYVEHRSTARYLAVAALMLLSLMCKPMAVTMPGILLLLDFWPLHRLDDALPTIGARFRRVMALVVEKLPLLAISIASAMTTMYVQLGQSALEERTWLTLGQRLQSVPLAYVSYLSKLFWPVDLAVLYPNPALAPGFHWPPWQVAGATSLLAFITVAGVLLRKRMPYLLMGWMWYLLTMVPVIGFVQIGRHFVADRYAYIPFIGLYLALVWLAADAISSLHRRGAAVAAGACAIAIVATLATAAHRQVNVWRDSVTLFSHAIAVTRDNWLMHNNLAGVLEVAGQRELALAHINQAAEICNDCVWVLEARGEMLYRAGQLFAAQTALESALQLDPGRARTHAALGLVLLDRGRFDLALEHLRRAVEEQPADGEWRMRLAAGLLRAGQPDQAYESMLEAMRLRPDRRELWQPLLDSINRARSATIGRTDSRTP